MHGSPEVSQPARRCRMYRHFMLHSLSCFKLVTTLSMAPGVRAAMSQAQQRHVCRRSNPCNLHPLLGRSLPHVVPACGRWQSYGAPPLPARSPQNLLAPWTCQTEPAAAAAATVCVPCAVVLQHVPVTRSFPADHRPKSASCQLQAAGMTCLQGRYRSRLLPSPSPLSSWL